MKAAVSSLEVIERVLGYNEGPLGTHGEYLSISQDASLAPMAASLTYQQAAGSTESYQPLLPSECE